MSVLRNEAARRVLAQVRFNHRHAGTNDTQLARMVNGRAGRAYVPPPVQRGGHAMIDTGLPRLRLHPRVAASDA